MAPQRLSGNLAMWQALCANLTYPLWDIKDGRGRLSELRSLQRSQHWEPAQLRELQLTRVRGMVEYAYRHCEFYRQRGEPPRIEKIEDLRALPLVNKSDIVGREDRFLSTQFQRSELVEARTGGSTGVSLTVFFDELCQKKRNAAAMRTDRWAGWSPGRTVGSLWGSPHLPRTLKEKLRNILHDRMYYLDTMHLDDSTMRAFADEIRERDITVLFGHAHSLFIFARFLRDAQIPAARMQAIISTSMMLLDTERKVIEEVFACAVTNRYGCEEVGLIASECEEHDGMHLNSEHVVVEFLREDGRPVDSGEEGRIVVTDLNNHGMPLIRYVIGDVGMPSSRRCRCGRGLQLMEKLTGRSADFLRRRDGVLVAGVSLVEKTLTAIHGIEQLQIVQNRLDEIQLNVVPSDAYDSEAERQLREVFVDVFGRDVQVGINKVARLSQERNSKYRFAICRL